MWGALANGLTPCNIFIKKNEDIIYMLPIRLVATLLPLVNIVIIDIGKIANAINKELSKHNSKNLNTKPILILDCNLLKYPARVITIKTVNIYINEIHKMYRHFVKNNFLLDTGIVHKYFIVSLLYSLEKAVVVKDSNIIGNIK